MKNLKKMNKDEYLELIDKKLQAIKVQIPEKSFGLALELINKINDLQEKVRSYKTEPKKFSLEDVQTFFEDKVDDAEKLWKKISS